MRENIGGVLKNKKGSDGKVIYRIVDDKKMDNVWKIPCLQPASKEYIGYPTQKNSLIIERIIKSSSQTGDIIADFFCGGGTTPVVAQKLNRKWIASDISRIAVAITADRIANIYKER